MEVTIRDGADAPVRDVHDLLHRTRWRDWVTEEDVRIYVERAFHVVTAWNGDTLVGLAVLFGDGRTYLELENLIVDEKHRGQGVGTRLMEAVMRCIDRVKPYSVKIEVFEERTERFYARFGFIRNEGTWLLDHKPSGDALSERIARIREPRQ